ncbi:MAG: TerB family tellurite resistance protein [Nannocystaceae bacterium]
MSVAPENKSALHVIAFLYLVFSHTTDANLGDAELKVIHEVLQKWVPNAPSAAVTRVIGETAEWYNSISDDAERFAEAERCAHLMGEQMSPGQQTAVLLNLIDIARADGKITAAEDAFIAKITEIFKLGSTRAT